MRFWDHVEELRKTLLRVGLVVALATMTTFVFHKSLFKLLIAPLPIKQLYLFSPIDGFVAALKLSFWSGLLLSSPFWVLFLLRFISPALRYDEKRVIFPFLGLSVLFIGCGVLFAYTVTLPLVIRFFLKFNEGIGENLWGIGQTINFALTLVLAHGLAFELYVGLLILIRFELLTASQLRRFRRPALILILFLSAILTPPDLLSQLLLTLPLLLLYEAAIFYAHFAFSRKTDRP